MHSVCESTSGFKFYSSGGFPLAADKTVTHTYDIASNESQISYPSGRVIGREYDVLSRLQQVIDDPAGTPASIAEFDYIGRYREARRTFGNGVVTSYAYTGFVGSTQAAGDKGFGHTSSITASLPGVGTIDERAFSWDAAGNRTTHDDLRSAFANRRDRSFTYDSSNRLVTSDTAYPDTSATLSDGLSTYTLDGVHNRTEVSVSAPGTDWSGAALGEYTQTGRQLANNQYTTTPGPGAAAGVETWVTTHDRNGNMVIQQEYCPTDFNNDGMLNILDVVAFTAAWNANEPEGDWNGDGNFDILDVVAFNNDHNGPTDRACEVRSFTYDYRDQLIETTIYDGGSFMSRTSHTYDALKRRTVEALDLPPPETAGADQTRRFVYAGVSRWEIIEELDGVDDTAAILVTRVPHGRRIDDEISHSVATLGGEFDDYYSHRDDMNTLYATTDDVAAVVERYDYGDYGDVRFLDGSGDPLPVPSGFANADTLVEARSLYTGRRPMPHGSTATGMVLVDYRHRVMEPYSGRFVQRDPLEYIDGPNLYLYALSSPATYWDPYGLCSSVSYPGCDKSRIRFRQPCERWAKSELYDGPLHQALSPKCREKMMNEAIGCCMGARARLFGCKSGSDCIRDAHSAGRRCSSDFTESRYARHGKCISGCIVNALKNGACSSACPSTNLQQNSASALACIYGLLDIRKMKLKPSSIQAAKSCVQFSGAMCIACLLVTSHACNISCVW